MSSRGGLRTSVSRMRLRAKLPLRGHPELGGVSRDTEGTEAH